MAVRRFSKRAPNICAVGRYVLEEEVGTILHGKRAIVFMPRWWYGTALAALCGFGIAVGAAIS